MCKNQGLALMIAACVAGCGVSESAPETSDVQAPTDAMDVAGPDVAEADTSESDTGAPDTSEPDTIEPDTSESDTGEPDTSESEPGDYGNLDHWICHPDLEEDLCRIDLDTTIVYPDGTTEIVPHQVAETPEVDCFYAYPTVSMDAAANSDLVAGDEERFTVRNHAARLSAVCRVFAPVYRQVTLQALFGQVSGPDFGMAFGDVRDAWQHYLTHHSDGRGVVLIGHSQGASHLRALIAGEIENDPDVRARIISAFIIGATVEVPEGADVGGSFQQMPLCREIDQTGCVVSYASFRDTAPPPAGSLFGHVQTEGEMAACNNPSALAGGQAILTPYFPMILPPPLVLVLGDGTAPFAADFEGATEITTPFFTLPGLVSGSCVYENGFSYLAVTVNADPVDAHPDDISGDFSPEWGLHLVDVSLAMGDILSLVESQAAAWLTP